MDTLSHGLWAAVAAKAINKLLKKREGTKPLDPWHAGFWGAFPDLLPFAPLFFIVLARILAGTFSFGDFGPGHAPAFPVSNVVGILYSLTHSAIVFGVIFGVVWLALKRPVWELGGWLLHILLDIPTHPADFYPTRFLWPLSSFTIGGISWITPTFLVVNYAVLGTLFVLLHEKAAPAAPPTKRGRLLRRARNVAFGAFVVIIVLATYTAFRARERAEETNEISVPTTSAERPATQTVSVYFSSRTEDPEGMRCNETYPAPRRIAKTTAPARAALEELLAGPDRVESERGFFTSINVGVKVNSLSVKDGVARADFNATIEAGVGGSCRVAAIASQIRNTLLQFPTVRTVVISVDGRTEDALQP